jgi:hypothetical protein
VIVHFSGDLEIHQLKQRLLDTERAMATIIAQMGSIRQNEAVENVKEEIPIETKTKQKKAEEDKVKISFCLRSSCSDCTGSRTFNRPWTIREKSTKHKNQLLKVHIVKLIPPKKC